MPDLDLTTNFIYSENFIEMEWHALLSMNAVGHIG